MFHISYLLLGTTQDHSQNMPQDGFLIANLSYRHIRNELGLVFPCSKLEAIVPVITKSVYAIHKVGLLMRMQKRPTKSMGNHTNVGNSDARNE